MHLFVTEAALTFLSDPFVQELADGFSVEVDCCKIDACIMLWLSVIANNMITTAVHVIGRQVRKCMLIFLFRVP